MKLASYQNGKKKKGSDMKKIDKRKLQAYIISQNSVT